MVCHLPALAGNGRGRTGATSLAGRRNIMCTRYMQRKEMFYVLARQEVIVKQITLKQEVLGNYQSATGRSRHDLVTPALILDLDVARRNITKMAEYMRTVPAKLRPHVK